MLLGQDPQGRPIYTALVGAATKAGDSLPNGSSTSLEPWCWSLLGAEPSVSTHVVTSVCLGLFPAWQLHSKNTEFLLLILKVIQHVIHRTLWLKDNTKAQPVQGERVCIGFNRQSSVEGKAVEGHVAQERLLRPAVSKVVSTPSPHMHVDPWPRISLSQINASRSQRKPGVTRS